MAGAMTASAALKGQEAAEAKPENEAHSSFGVRAFGARGDGKTLDTAAINRAIEAAENAGGGTVHFPAGQYLCHTIYLKSDVALYLDQGAVIIAADALAEGQTGGYDDPEPEQPWEAYQDYGHNHWHNSLIWGEGLSNISILGPGRIWGRDIT
jgi:polygalacturonase